VVLLAARPTGVGTSGRERSCERLSDNLELAAWQVKTPQAPSPEPHVDVTVVGSIHRDIVIDVPALPRPGETVLGLRHFRSAGGKGANQAVAARRLGAAVAMVGQVGDDPDGAALRAGLQAEGLDVSGVTVYPGLATGLAVVGVDREGENAIVVSPGASGALDAATVRRHAEVVAGAGVLLLQLEVTLAAVEAAAGLATGTVVLNPAPARQLPAALLDRVDVLVPNRVELARLAGIDDPPDDLGGVRDAAARLADRCAVVVSLGADGVLVVTGDAAVHVRAPAVDVVDTTGAGDAFCGALAVRLAAGDGLEAAARVAVRAAAISTTRPGAQPSLPTLDELERFET
jgi:ribokinase